jgi:hypothetical protein
MLAGCPIINESDPAIQSIRRVGFLADREFGPGIVSNTGTRACAQRLKKLALAELEALAGAFLPVLLALSHTRIARQETVAAQSDSQVSIKL